jgi:hypothetical protein
LPAGSVKHVAEADGPGFDGGAGVGAGEDEELADHTGHPVGLGGDVAEGTRAERLVVGGLGVAEPAEQVDGAADAGERGAQLVGAGRLGRRASWPVQ